MNQKERETLERYADLFDWAYQHFNRVPERGKTNAY